MSGGCCAPCEAGRCLGIACPICGGSGLVEILDVEDLGGEGLGVGICPGCEGRGELGPEEGEACALPPLHLVVRLTLPGYVDRIEGEVSFVRPEEPDR